MRVVPTPKVIQTKNVPTTIPATICTDFDCHMAVDSFIAYATKIGIAFTLCEQGAICVRGDDSLPAGAYKLIVEPNEIVILAKEARGVHYAFATLLQIMDAGEQKDKFTVPVCRIEDSGDCAYRGMMVDLARVWHDFSYLLNYVDMCYFYKVGVLHLHFTDSQSYTLPSDLYPELPTKDRHYTKDQIATLVAYANARGIQLMPEIDVPGHCDAFGKAYPEIFNHEGIVPMHDASMDFMRNLFGELCAFFPDSTHIHIGGDEADVTRWTRCAQCVQYGADRSLNTADEFLAHFVSEMAKVVFAAGKVPVVWEGFSKTVNGMVSKDILVMSWENYYQTTPDLIDADFRVINCSWNPMYVVEPSFKWDPTDIYNWSIYRWIPVHPESPYKGQTLELPPSSSVLGGQLLAWGDQIIVGYEDSFLGVLAERDALIARLPYLAENTWNVQKRKSFTELSILVEFLNNRLQLLLKRQ